jgi:hypothetical protein
MLGKGGTKMKRRSSEDSWQVFNSVTDAAERFVNHSPRLKRLEAERQVLLDAIRRAQLLLSVTRLPIGTESGSRVPSERTPRRRQGKRSTREK